MFRLFIGKSKKTSSQNDESDESRWRRILIEQQGYITKVCAKAASGMYSDGSNQSFSGDGGTSYQIHQNASIDANELFVHVIDHLKEDNYRRIREFQGRSSITTYLTVIIDRLTVNIVRQRAGRNRAKERTEHHGELGRHVYELMVNRGHTADEAEEILSINFNINTSADELRKIHKSLLGRDVRHQSCGDTETAWGTDGEFVVVQRQTPEMELIGHTQREKRSKVLATLVEGLKGEEQLLVRLRFLPDDETHPLDMKQIAAITGQTPQQADRKLRRILQSCRELLLKKGHSLENLL